jgi:hypothetical protein
MSAPYTKTKMFKSCKNCEKTWNTRDDFLNDPDIVLVGYQPNFTELTLGLFLFNHKCRTTLAVPVNQFTDMYQGDIFKECLLGSEACQGLCQDRKSLDPCMEKCECAYVRQIMQRLK